MKHHLSFFLLLLMAEMCSAQLIDNAHINFAPYKGKLIILNEAHAIASNDKVYEHIIRQITTQLSPGDSINIIIEQSYSVSYLQNNIMQGTGKVYGSLVKYTKGLPVRYIGVDFERIEKEKDSANTLFLSDIIIKLEEQNIPTRQLKTYRDAIRSRNSDESKVRRSLIELYTKEQEKSKAGTGVYYTLEQLLFVLTAKYDYINLRKRDEGNYERLLKAEKKGLIKFSNNYNILIHGTCHTDPAMKHGIYRRFLDSKDSPFKDNVYFIGQAYIDCISAKDFFRETPVQITHSIFCDDIFSVTDHFSEKYKGKLQPGNIMALPSNSSIPDIAQYQGRIIGWYLHWKVGAEK